MSIDPTSQPTVYTPSLPTLVTLVTGSPRPSRSRTRRASRSTHLLTPLVSDPLPSEHENAASLGISVEDHNPIHRFTQIYASGPSLSNALPESPSESELFEQYHKFANLRSVLAEVKTRFHQLVSESQNQSEADSDADAVAMSNGYPPAGSSGPGAGGQGQGPWGGPFPALHLWPLHDTFQMKMIHLPAGERVSGLSCAYPLFYRLHSLLLRC